jgi:hypothetical protein
MARDEQDNWTQDGTRCSQKCPEDGTRCSQDCPQNSTCNSQDGTENGTCYFVRPDGKPHALPRKSPA